MGVIINREWAMPSHNTLSIKPIYKLVARYLKKSKLSADPFARDCQECDLTNDLNRETKAQFNLMADKFLEKVMSENRVDLVIFDPPYSLRQVKECYDSYGTGFTHRDSQNAVRWTIERDIISKYQKIGDIVISFGWTTACMGKKRGYNILEILICSHGPAHNDTLITVEKKVGYGIAKNKL